MQQLISLTKKGIINLNIPDIILNEFKKAMNERETLLLELDEAKEKVQEQESKGFWARLFGK